MSSMRNAVQRRNHKERAQPIEREKWGLLEKRKDYKLRAADHKNKQKRLKILKQKASERNPDEFSFKMMSSKVDSKGIKLADRGNKALSMDVVKLLKTQDVGYIRTMLQMVRKEREQLEEQIMVEEEGVKAFKDGIEERKRNHLVFVDDEEQQKAYKPSASGFGKKQAHAPMELDEEDLEERTPTKLSRKQLEAMKLAEKEERALLRKREKAQEKKVGYLEHVKSQETDLMAAEEELEAQRAKMNNTVGGTNKNGVKFKIRERKR